MENEMNGYVQVACGVLLLISLWWIKRLGNTRLVYLHEKSGREYVVLCIARMEANCEKCVVYTSAEHVEGATIWVRGYDEFFDGRFSYVRKMIWDKT